MPPGCRQILKCYLVFSHLCRILILLPTDGSRGCCNFCRPGSPALRTLTPSAGQSRLLFPPSPAPPLRIFPVTSPELSSGLERLERLERLEERIKKISNLHNNGHQSWRRQLSEMTSLARYYIKPGVSRGKHALVR